MPGLKEFCALLLAGGMGASSVVAVQKAKPAIARKAAPAKQKVAKPVQRQARTEQARECEPRILDMPLSSTAPSVAPVPVPNLQPMAQQFVGMGATPPQAILPGPGGGSPARPRPLPTPPAIPDVKQWVQLVAGFGLTGLALRRRPIVSNRQKGMAQ